MDIHLTYKVETYGELNYDIENFVRHLEFYPPSWKNVFLVKKPKKSLSQKFFLHKYRKEKN